MRGQGLTVFGTLFMAGVLAIVAVLPILAVLSAVVTSPLALALVVPVAAGGIVTPFVALCLVALYADLRSRFATPAARFSVSPR